MRHHRRHLTLPVVLRSEGVAIAVGLLSSHDRLWVGTTARTANRLLQIVIRVIEPDRWWVAPTVVTGVEGGVLLSLHHVLGRSVVETRVHATGRLWEVRRLLLVLLWVVRAVLWLLWHHVHHARILLLHLLRHSTVDEWLLGRVI